MGNDKIKTAIQVLHDNTDGCTVVQKDGQNIPYYNHDEVLKAIHAYHAQFNPTEDKVVEGVKISQIEPEKAAHEFHSEYYRGGATSEESAAFFRGWEEPFIWRSQQGKANAEYVKYNALVEELDNKIIALTEQQGKEANMIEVFKWLLGYYDFPEPPSDGRPRYYWRSHLQEKLKEIGIDIKSIESPFQPRETDKI